MRCAPANSPQRPSRQATHIRWLASWPRAPTGKGRGCTGTPRSSRLSIMRLKGRRRTKCGDYCLNLSTMKSMKGMKREFSELSNRVIGCAIEVHRVLGSWFVGIDVPMAHELKLNGIG